MGSDWVCLQDLARSARHHSCASILWGIKTTGSWWLGL
jgi:hypothetical protein